MSPEDRSVLLISDTDTTPNNKRKSYSVELIPSPNNKKPTTESSITSPTTSLTTTESSSCGKKDSFEFIDDKQSTSPPTDGIADCVVYDSFLCVVKRKHDIWPKVKNRVKKLCKETHLSPGTTTLALCLAKYDYYGAPSNWTCHLEIKSMRPHEFVIVEWVHWLIEKKDKYQHRIREMFKNYKYGNLTDCSDLMEDYFE